jgi:hypothetical protein
MKKIFKALNVTAAILFLMVSFIACDKDFSTIESDVLGEDNFNFNTDKVTLPIIAYNKKLDSLQINNLSSNLLGVFFDPVYGQTTASIISQIAPSGYAPDFGGNPVVDSVILSIPYYSRALTDSTYTISDSLYGNAPIRLSIYRNNYFLRDFDPTASNNAQQNYYSLSDGSINGTDNFARTSNTTINFDTNKGELIFEDPSFVPSDKTIITVTMDEDSTVTKTKSPPAFRVHLDTAYWKTTILGKQGQPELSNENNFKNYFRGLYFKAEAISGSGNMVLLNMASTDARITIYYTFDDSGTPGKRTQSTYNLNLSSSAGVNINRINTFTNNHSFPLTNGNKTLGDEKLYLKGMAGSMAVIDLFGGMVECANPDGSTSLISALECFKKTYRKLDENGNYLPPVNGQYALKQLINEARLVIYEDESMAGPTDFHKYDRIYAYDLKSNSITADYGLDPTANTSQPISSRIVSLGQRDPNKLAYKVRLTEHLNNILVKDSINTKIGLVLSSNVNIVDGSKILNSNDIVTEVPSASIITPRGTVLYGTNTTVPANKKMVLEVFFTKPK